MVLRVGDIDKLGRVEQKLLITFPEAFPIDFQGKLVQMVAYGGHVIVAL